MKIHVLIRITPSGKYYMVQTCWPKMDFGENLKTIAESRSGAVLNIRELISGFFEEFGRRYIESNEFNNKLNCPQGYIELPLDSWYCKTAKTACPRQGELDRSDPKGFFNLCLLSEETKKGIWNAIIEGRYNGFHHIPGRFRCGLCDKPRTYYNYHYPWELTSLSDHCDIFSIWSDIKRAKALILEGFPREAISAALCCECFFKASNFLPEVNLFEYDIIIYDYLRNK